MHPSLSISGQGRLFRNFLRPRRPLGSYNPKDYFFDVKSEIKETRDQLYEVIQMRVSCDDFINITYLLLNAVERKRNTIMPRQQ
jgi:anaphase-promoting complex subunit 5